MCYSNYYRGWVLSHRYIRPVSGRWVAARHGVTMCHSTREGLINMIDARLSEEQSARDARARA